jgi:hypothetical protein
MIASLKWGCSANPKHLAGVNFDAVLTPTKDELVVIEITKRNDLQKIREDISKINAIRLQKVSEGIVVRAFIVTEYDPTISMVETGDENRVIVISVGNFFNYFFKYDNYNFLRSRRPFGSAINQLTGDQDAVEYIPVVYQKEDRKPLDVDAIAGDISGGNAIILIGDYGSGKSRCVAQTFLTLTTTRKQFGLLVFAIDLREHWGASSASEIIAGHLEGLGLTGLIDNAMQIVAEGGAILLLDGVDEVGAQTFGETRDDRISVRRSALAGVRKLIETNKGGVLITTRAHYFDSDDEMIASLGFSKNRNLTIARCPEEFSYSESTQYLQEVGLDLKPPEWLPRKPLVFQVLSSIDSDLASELLEKESGELLFWNCFITAISEREARIHGSLQSGVVTQILLNLAEMTRESDNFLGRVSVKNIREAYELATGQTPDQAGEHMLMRLCTLGRVAPSSPERQFVDGYIIDGLRSEALIRSIDNKLKSLTDKTWKQPLRRFGWELLQNSLVTFGKEGLYKSTLSMLSSGRNNQAYAEILSALLSVEGHSIKCDGITLKSCEIYSIVFGARNISGISIENSYIENMEICPQSNTDQSTVLITNCIINNMYGISSDIGLPKWIENSTVEQYENMSTASRIKASNLDTVHMLFLAVIHKIFFQPGAGRTEQSLLKGGFGEGHNTKVFEKIINLLLREKVVERIQGDQGYIYKPVRKHTRRMQDIKGQLSHSKDPLWNMIGMIN